MQRVRGLYENSAVPVREIARLAGVSERTLYKYVRKGGWRRRYAGRGAAAAAKNRGRRHAAAAGFAPVKGAGGRFIAREDAGRPFARGIKAHDPSGRARAASACAQAARLSVKAKRQAAAQAKARAALAAAERKSKARLRTIELLCGALVELAKLRAKWRGSERTRNMAERLQHAIVDAMERV
ncbi:MAG: hypothetical protein WD039_02455 [Xanthobacteraceae bacterium]